MAQDFVVVFMRRLSSLNLTSLFVISDFVVVFMRRLSSVNLTSLFVISASSMFGLEQKLVLFYACTRLCH